MKHGGINGIHVGRLLASSVLTRLTLSAAAFTSPPSPSFLLPSTGEPPLRELWAYGAGGGGGAAAVSGLRAAGGRPKISLPSKEKSSVAGALTLRQHLRGKNK